LQLQVQPPATNTRRRRAYDDEEEDGEGASSDSQRDSLHASLSEVFLPPPDPSSTMTSLFGTARTEASDEVEQLYAAQMASIVFSSGQRGGEEGGADGSVLGGGKPVVVGLGLKPGFVEPGEAGGDGGRERFAGVMKMLGDVVGQLA